MSEIGDLGGRCYRCGVDNTLALVVIVGELKYVLCESCRADPAVQRDLYLERERIQIGPIVTVRGEEWPCSRGDHEHCPAVNTHPAIVESEMCPCECHMRELDKMAE